MKEEMPPDYESAYAELQELLRALQEDQVSIDKLSALVARAHLLIGFCREKLRHTEEDVKKLG